MKPRAVYLHVPFCAHRCGYCNFTLVAGRDDLQDAYLGAVAREIEGVDGGEVDSIFFGGGTPTRLTPERLAKLCRLVAERFPPAPNCEWSVEANPADVTSEIAAVLAAAGVNRVSLGAQSFSPRKLGVLERDHAPEAIAAASERVRPFAQVGIDLIFAAPGETLAEWEADLVAAVALAPDHVSTYGLTIEQGTAFWSRRARGALREVAESPQAAMYTAAFDRLPAAGLEQYEVSNFARPGARCRHNEVYWTGGAYHAFGPGAARHVGGRRETNHRSVFTYLARIESGRSPVAESEQLDPEAKARELLVFGLRRTAGVERSWFAERSGVSLDALVGPIVAGYVERGLLSDDGQTIKLTRRGLLVSDALWPAML